MPLRNPGDSRRTLNQTRLWEGGAPRRAPLPVFLVESDAWSRAAPGKMGHDVCDAVGGYAGQTKPHNPTPTGSVSLPKEEEGHIAKNSVVDI